MVCIVLYCTYPIHPSIHPTIHLDICPPIAYELKVSSSHPTAVSLAQLGHTITLLDISRSELNLAAQHASSSSVSLDGIHVADASRLFETCPALLPQVGTFDAVLMLGPLYHLLGEEERVKALRDAGRLLKEPRAEDGDGEGEGGGVLFASFVTTFGHLRGVARRDPGRLSREKEWYGRYLGLGEDDGDGKEKENEKGRYTRRKDEGVVSYHVHPSEIRELFAKVEIPHQEYPAQNTSGEFEEKGRVEDDCGNLGLQVQKIVACEGFLGAELAGNLNGLGGEEWRVWMDVLERFAGDESVLGASEHLLAVVRIVG